jgi:hypothetical protein
MLAELAAANAAFDVIKQSIQNGKEIWEAGEAVADYFGLKTEIQKKAHEHGYRSDFAAFQASEQLRAQEEELKQMMIWQGRPGMWTDWLTFQAECKQAREQQRLDTLKAKLRRRRMLTNGLVVGSACAFALVFIIGLVYIIMQYAG